MDSRRIAALLGVLGLLAWLWPWGALPPAPEADSAPPARRERPQPTSNPRLAGRPDEPLDEPRVADDPVAPVVRAFERLAEASGDGLIRCSIGPGVRDGHVYGLPGFSQREGDVLIGAVPVASGEVALTRERLPIRPDASFEELSVWLADADDPANDFAVARWESAHAGSWGTCVVDRLSPVEIDARLGRDPDALEEPTRLDADDAVRRAEAFAAAVAIAREADDGPAVQERLSVWSERAAAGLSDAERMVDVVEIATELLEREQARFDPGAAP